jgi:DNA topoisomerase-3
MHAWNNLIDLDWRAADAVDARSELDFRIGAAFSRFQTLSFRPQFSELKDQKVISYGMLDLRRNVSVSNSSFCSR